MKYNVGDKVRIKSISDIGKLIDDKGYVGNIPFGHTMNLFCGKVMTISWVCADCYTMVEDLENYYCDEMIECKVEEENLNLKFKAGDRVFNKVTRKWVNIIEFDIETGLYVVRYDDGIQGRSLECELCEMEE